MATPSAPTGGGVHTDPRGDRPVAGSTGGGVRRDGGGTSNGRDHYDRDHYGRAPRSGHVHTDRCHGYGVDHYVFFYPRAPYSPYYHGDRPTRPEANLQRKPLDREGSVSLSLGVTGLHSGYTGVRGDVTDRWTDTGAGLAIEVRPTSGFGVEASIIGYSEETELDRAREHVALQLSAVGYALPDFPVSPYILGGASYVPRDVDDTFWNGQGPQNYTADSPTWGPHVGLGLEFSLGRHAILNVEGRAMSFLDHRQDEPALPGALQSTVALGVIF